MSMDTITKRSNTTTCMCMTNTTSTATMALYQNRIPTGIATNRSDTAIHIIRTYITATVTVSNATPTDGCVLEVRTPRPCRRR
jgi:hypothetical protein